MKANMFDQLFEKLIKVDEVAVLTKASPQEKMRSHYKNVLNGKLKPSTYSSEKDWLKFWLLTDGTHIPVVHSHERTADEVDIRSDNPFGALMDDGAFAGSIKIDQSSMMVSNWRKIKLTRQQISKLKQFYVQYKPDEVYVDLKKSPSSHSFRSPIKSVEELDYRLEYGMDESKLEAGDKEKLDYFLERTNKHIELVQAAAAKIVDAYPEEFADLTKEVEDHDASKLEEPERTPYINITWRHKLEKEQGEFDPLTGKGYQTPGNLEKKDENEATLHHIQSNKHHPEYWLEDKKEANINVEDRDKLDKVVDASRMPDINIAEMIADWQAMGEELGNPAMEWFNKVKDVRWHFSEHQEELIDRLLKVFE